MPVRRALPQLFFRHAQLKTVLLMPDPEREAQDGERGESRAANEPPEGVAHVLTEGIHRGLRRNRVAKGSSCL